MSKPLRSLQLMIVTLLVVLVGSASGADVFWDPTGDGIVVVEAESFTSKDAQWVEDTATEGFTGTGYVEAQGGGTPFCGDYTCAASAPALHYDVDLPSAGNWEVWLRGSAADGGSDSAHVGVDGVVTPDSDQLTGFYDSNAPGEWRWSKSTGPSSVAVINVTTPGLHDFFISRREYGLKVDKIVLIHEGSGVPDPEDFGPDETPDVVPTPFDPVVATQSQGGSWDVTVWGRSYEFDDGPIPTSVYTQGVRFLKNTGGQLVQVRTAGGSWQTPAWGPVQLVSQHQQRVVLQGTGTLANGLELTCVTTIEYDGMIAFDFTLHNAGASPVTVTDVLYNNILEKSRVDLMLRHADISQSGPENGIDKTTLTTTGGPFPSDEWIDYTPTLFVGDRQIGIEWWMETDSAWDTVQQPIRLNNTGSSTAVQFFPIKSGSTSLAAGASWNDRLLMFPMPMREPDSMRHRRFGPHGSIAAWVHDTSTSDYSELVTLPGYLPETVGLHRASRDGNSPTNYTHQQTLAALQLAGVHYMPYGFLQLAPYPSPENTATTDNINAWKANTALVDPLKQNQNTYFACAGVRDYFEWHRRHVEAAIRDPAEEIEGVYFDYGGISRMCTQSPLYSTGKQVWEYENVREYYKRLYEVLHREGRSTLVVSHNNGAPKALSAFIDESIVGEALNAQFCHKQDPNATNCDTYDPDYASLPSRFLDSLLYPIVGGTTALIPQIRYNCAKVDNYDLGLTFTRQRELQGIGLVNDYPMPWWNGYEYAEQLSCGTDPIPAGVGFIAVANAVDMFGSLDTAVFHPWWSNGSEVTVTTSQPGIEVSVYDDPDPQEKRQLVVVENTASTTAYDIDITLDEGSFSLGSQTSYRNPEACPEGSPAWQQSSSPGHVSTQGPIAAGDFQLILAAPMPYTVTGNACP